MSDPINFAKMAADLDTNPKVRRSGRNGREVYLFVLRRVALLKRPGSIPVSNVDPGYMAHELLMPEADALDGIQACLKQHKNPITNELEPALLSIHNGEVFVEGWNDDWGRRPLTNAERQQRHRDRKKPGDEGGGEGGEDPRNESRGVTRSNASNGSDQTREDQKRHTQGDQSDLGGSGSDAVPPEQSASSSSSQPAVARTWSPLAWEPGLNDANVYASMEALRIGVVVDFELKKFRVLAFEQGWSERDCIDRWPSWLLKAHPTKPDVREALARVDRDKTKRAALDREKAEAAEAARTADEARAAIAAELAALKQTGFRFPARNEERGEGGTRRVQTTTHEPTKEATG